MFFIRDFVQFKSELCPFWILFVLDFAQSRTFSSRDVVQFGILFVLNFVQFGILSVRDFVFRDFVQDPKGAV